jgi:uncharacterized membrane protein
MALCGLACGDAEEGGTSGLETGASCDPTITYEGFVQPFVEQYCTRCHSSTLSAEQRNGAPLGHDFDSRAGIDAVLLHFEQQAAGGPKGVNDAMPPNGAKPSVKEREQLGAWVACERASLAGGAHDAGAD